MTTLYLLLFTSLKVKQSQRNFFQNLQHVFSSHEIYICSLLVYVVDYVLYSNVANLNRSLSGNGLEKEN